MAIFLIPASFATPVRILRIHAGRVCGSLIDREPGPRAVQRRVEMLKMSDRGLIDVDGFDVVPLSAG
jgi:hypothetical protein